MNSPNLQIKTVAPSLYIMLGGFLGAGKSTTLRALAHWLAARNLRPGLITNDQGAGLVDTALARNDGLATEEITGGCFCCRFSSLMGAAVALRQSVKPDVFLAEPVGSCTDLVATVSLPLSQMYGDQYRVAPFSVLVDPLRAERVLGLEEGRKFSDNVLYIYRKQLEEAQHIVINKADLLDEGRLARLEEAMQSSYPQARVWVVSARDGRGLEPWFESLMTETRVPDRIMDVDYPLYAEGEALLGWLNGSVEIFGEDFDGNRFLLFLASEMQKQFLEADMEVAHLKMTLSPAGDPYELAAVNLVRGDAAPELSHRLAEPLDDAVLLVNCRAEADAGELKEIAGCALEACAREFAVRLKAAPWEFFQPSPPKPEYRVAAVC